MKKNILIITSFLNFDDVKDYVNPSHDILAFTSSAMLTLEILNIPYKTTADFYKPALFRDDLKKSHSEIEILFAELDKISEAFCDFPYAYSGNISYFIDFFSNLLYLEKLSRQLMDTYKKVYLVSNNPIKKITWDNLKYTDLKSKPIHAGISLPLSNGLENKIEILQKLLKAELISSKFEHGLVLPEEFPLRTFFKKVKKSIQKGYLKRKFYQPINFFVNNFNKRMHPTENKKIFIVQGGYEIENIKNYLTEFNYSNSIVSLREKAPSVFPEHYPFKDIRDEILLKFERYFPNSLFLIIDLFQSYHREIVGRIPYYSESFRMLISKDTPQMLLFSVGTRDIYDCIFGFIANQKNINVLYFQHGGSSAFYKNINKKYVEYDPKIKKTLIRSSSVREIQHNNGLTECVSLGSSLRYEMMQDHKNNGGHKMLFCCNCPSFYTYKHIINSASDIECHHVSRDLIESANENLIDLDIKLHPVEEKASYFYYQRLIKTVKAPNTRIIYKTQGEEIIKSYGLLIFDFLCSALFSHAIILKVPIILYLKDMSVVKKSVIKDLKSRCYIVNNRAMLDKVLEQYKIGNLPSKWSINIIEKYICPVKKGNPVSNISNYIRSMC